MVLTFLTFADLLESLEQVEKPSIQVKLRSVAVDAPKEPTHKLVIQRWFKRHRQAIDALSASSATALLSTFLPERRTDRVYGLQPPSLSRVLGRCLGLSAARVKDLLAYTEPGNGDLAECLQRVLRAGGTQALPAITLDDLDTLCDELASTSRFSAPALRTKRPVAMDGKGACLKHLFNRASPLEGKWLVRLLLKDLSPVRIDEYTVIRSMHFLLWDVLRFQNNFASAFDFLKGEIARQGYPSDPDERSVRALKASVMKYIKPTVGIKVGRPNFFKARSIDHCMGDSMLGKREWCLERKYDGEYCEIHIQCSDQPPSHWIKIFSKSGKDSTLDRKDLHSTLVDSLQLGKPQCRIQRQAILLGELVVWDDSSGCVAPFDKIRKHVSRSGVYLGSDRDSQPSPHEHLAIVFYDLLLLDDDVVLRRSVNERRVLLRSVYRKLPGRAFSAEWKIIDFSSDLQAQKKLMEQFAASIAQRCEGLVLKPCNVPYFDLHEDQDRAPIVFIKLKKDYMDGMGDEVDFAVVGGSYNAQHALRTGCRGLLWTAFYLGCLTNAEDVRKFGRKRHYKIVAVLHARDGCIPLQILKVANQLGSSSSMDFDPHNISCPFDIDTSQVQGIKEVFTRPIVFEVLGSSFVKPPSCDFLMLRHPRVKKIHQDRDWQDCASFHELQKQAREALVLADRSDSQETRIWLEKMAKKMKRKHERQQLTTPGTDTTTSPSKSVTRSNESRENSRGKSNHRSSVEGQVTSRKRKLLSSGPEVESPCRPRKRLRHQNIVQTLVGNAPIEISRSSFVEQSSPLADITNQTIGRRRTSGASNHQNASRQLETNNSERKLCARQRHENAFDSGPIPCLRSSCVFSKSVILLAPCVAAMPYVTDDLLSLHDLERTEHLIDWDRASVLSSELTEVVEESQAYPGRRKLVLVEAQGREVVKDIVLQMVGLNDGSFAERVEVYDWRILEACRHHDLGVDKAKEYFIGATIFDTQAQEAVFVSNVDWLRNQRGI